MSFGSSSRYQSKLFNFVYQQSRRLTQTWENTFHNLQVATQWSLQALLYPLYLLLQPDELSSKVLESKETESPLKSDAAIEHILEVVKNLPSGRVDAEENLPIVHPLDSLRKTVTNLGWWKSSSRQNQSLQPENTLQYHIPKVEGIANQLVTRNLVLVTTNNRILDVLTHKQQTTLTTKINDQIAEYWHDFQLTPEINQILEKLTNQSPQNITTENQFLLNPIKWLGLVDNILAKLEAKTLVPVKQRSQEIIQTAKIQLNIFVYGQGELENRVNEIDNQPVDILALIEAAINYFFGGRNSRRFASQRNQENLKGQGYHFTKILSKNEEIIDLQTDIWLNWDDLFSDSPNGQKQFYSTEQTETKPDWIEAKVTFLGYEKHPLEEILAWIDLAILWLEHIFINFCYFLKGLSQGKG
ncbi:hypothetical protein VB711_07660 [Cronbergia sp. UHCC 0137]|uniref:hypothetical protein n=1 Tax=Cronbergia sp. UHCC 0137 TaxID=3110239 RepID=UPI002B1F6C8A|nr:hypothetical protein [Cronbergia sp. UHCC 0137]MEA5617712.1 hypothetical protein [Cronbergia sp. UHCC 0137]